jgi:hypothetical protein
MRRKSINSVINFGALNEFEAEKNFSKLLVLKNK